MKPKIRIGGGMIVFAVFILLGGYRYMDIRTVLPWLFAALTHETGHYLAAHLCGAKIEKMTLDVIGARMSLAGKLISYGEETIISVAGPAVNIAFALLSFPHLPSFAEFSLMLGILNLIPAPGFDGYRILCSVLSGIFGADISEKVMKWLSFFAVLFLWLTAVYTLLRYRAGFSLFLLSCALFVGFLRK